MGLLKKQSERFDFGVQAYCLMANHVHVVATPSIERPLALAIGRPRTGAESGKRGQNR